MEPKGDPDFKKLVDDTIIGMMKDGQLDALYKKWFESPVPPKNVNLNWPVSEQLKKAIANPTDSPEPDAIRLMRWRWRPLASTKKSRPTSGARLRADPTAQDSLLDAASVSWSKPTDTPYSLRS